MSFFTLAGVARYALQRGHFRLWDIALKLDGPSLVPAEQLANAAASPNFGIWARVSKTYEDALDDPACVLQAFYRTVESDNVMLMDALRLKLKNTFDADELLLRMARYGAHDCWLHAMSKLGLEPSATQHDALVDAAVANGNARIMLSLQYNKSLADELQARIRSKRELDDQVRGRNVHYLQNVLRTAEWLKSDDYAAALAFARDIRRGYLTDFIHRKMDEADVKWAGYASRNQSTTGNVHYLKRAA